MRSIRWSINDCPAEVTNLPTQLLHGDDAIEEELCGLRFRMRPNAFLQTNTAMAGRLYGLAREHAQLTGEESVYDLYCGIGTIGLALAADALTVLGVEVSEESVACVLENAELKASRTRRSLPARSATCSTTCVTAPATRTLPSSTRPGPGSQARPSAASQRSRRSGSSTSRATRRPLAGNVKELAGE